MRDARRPRGGVDYTIRAFAQARAANPALRLRIAGNGPLLPKLRELAAQLRVDDAVQFLGFLPRERIFSLLSESDIFVQHNVRTRDAAEEALGGSILEASACGLPVLGTRSGGVPRR